MNLKRPKSIAFFIAAMLTLVVLIVLIAINIKVASLGFGVYVFASIFVFAITYFALIFFLEKLIQDRINIIYKSIHNLRYPSAIMPDLNMNEDVLDKVHKEVLDWGEKQQQEINALVKQAEFRREFIGNLSHELKTPIFNIQGYIHSLLDGALDDPNFNVKFLTRASKSVERMADMVEELDTITQFESGNLKLGLEVFNIVELARDVIESLEHSSEEKGIKMVFDKAYNQPINVRADRGRIEQVFTNLMVNSIKYGNENGETELRFFDIDKNILVEIADNGPGISKDHLPRLFERFYRVDKSRARHKGGTGLGLAIVKHIIDAHDQSINVRSTEDVGSIFSFTVEKV